MPGLNETDIAAFAAENAAVTKQIEDTASRVQAVEAPEREAIGLLAKQLGYDCGVPYPAAVMTGELTRLPKGRILPTSIVRLCKEKLMKEAKTKSKNELLPGTLEMLILKTLSIESMHGYGIAQHIQMLSADVLTIEEGSLYPALQRMLVKGWVLAEWKISANNRRARFYTLTTAGKRQLGVEESRFSQMFGAIMRVMKTT